MLLLDVRVQRWVTQIRFGTVAALEVATFHIVLGATLSLATTVILLTVIIPLCSTKVAIASVVSVLTGTSHSAHQSWISHVTRHALLVTDLTTCARIHLHVLPWVIVHVVPHWHDTPAVSISRCLSLIHVGMLVHHALASRTSSIEHHVWLVHVA